MKYTVIYAFVSVLIVFSCKEMERFDINKNDTTPPGQPFLKSYKPLYGGARFFYMLPDDEDLLSVEAEFTNTKNQVFKFSASYFVDSLDVYGLPDTDLHTIRLFAVDRAGNRSKPVEVEIEPLEPAYLRVANTMEVKSGFSSFFVDWENELKQNINVYVDFEFNESGRNRTLTSVFSSNLEKDRRFINDLYLKSDEKIKVKVRVEDVYGNMTDQIDKGEISLLEDMEIPKAGWTLPNANDSIGGVPMVFGDGLEGRTRNVIDGIIDRGDNLNFMHTNTRGRTGRIADGNMPWNLMIDLGDYYELSRIVTVQRHSGGLANINRGQYYKANNVGHYRMYYWDDDLADWQLISEHQIPVVEGLSDLDYVKLGEAGDLAYMYPDEPKYTKKTRWFRYEAVKGFTSNYTLDDGHCLSEVTLYGRKATD
ncbi:DUF4959 domain-containing protein [Sphingobacterium chuzhouense]|uniref:DUF4959 domain-containing protein n=1 Tax=Sphingobacterium chuzhouense TaxID=1742264 RepID=A0ABR7XRP3_9SPHI|nr:DUF4959 domain-containing protein [Sphingobacterium chuzhouense]MBD1421844.1 DUF4959 domain-containing protein [Sphingobacterium chuzhouense]